MTASLSTATDKPMPQSPDAERAVLGSVLYNRAVLDRVSPPLTVDDFFNEANRTIFRVMVDLENDGTAVDHLTLKNELANRAMLDRIGGYAYITSLTDFVPDIANAERYATIVRETAQLRSLLSLYADGMKRIGDGGESATEIAADIAERSHSISPVNPENSVIELEEMAARLAALYEGGGVERGASTCWPSLDAHYTVPAGAWTLITGIPGHGKSGFLDHLAINMADSLKWQTVMFSAENFPPESHIASLIEKYIGEPFNEGPTKRMSMQSVRAGLSFLHRHFRFIDPSSERMSLDRVLATATALAQQRPVNILAIDPWNELHHERSQFVSETEYISASLTKVRRWARRHRAHVFVVAHPKMMQKEKDSGRYSVPTPYDVSGSAHWRNKADYCLCVYRELGEVESPDVDIHVQKVRRREIGRLGRVTLRYDKVTSRYEDPQARRMTWEERQMRFGDA